MQVHLEIKQKSVLENLQNKDAFYHLNKCSEFKHTLSALRKSNIGVFSFFHQFNSSYFISVTTAVY